MNAKVSSPARKPYAKPTLQQYGTIRALTQSRGATGRRDGGSAAMLKQTDL